MRNCLSGSSPLPATKNFQKRFGSLKKSPYLCETKGIKMNNRIEISVNGASYEAYYYEEETRSVELAFL